MSEFTSHGSCLALGESLEEDLSVCMVVERLEAEVDGLKISHC